MEIIICIIVIILIRNRKISSNASVQIEELPLGKNPKGYFEEDAFTEIYHRLKQ